MKLGKSVSSTKNSIIEYFKRKGLFDELPEINDIFSVKKRNAMKKIEFGNQMKFGRPKAVYPVVLSL